MFKSIKEQNINLKDYESTAFANQMITRKSDYDSIVESLNIFLKANEALQHLDISNL